MESAPLSGLSVLVLDDEPLLRRHLKATLERMGADVTAAETCKMARQLASEGGFDFALLDIHLPDGLGTDLLRDKVFGGSTGVVVMTAEGGISSAVESMRLGALEYLTKPFEPEALALVLARARRTRQAARALEHQQAEAPEGQLFFGKALSSLENQLRKILQTDERMVGGATPPPVLIQGETGTGKSTIARWLHANGPRRKAPLVETNCASIPESLAESEFFGHERGAFTDARSTRIGLFEAASGGTLFLDELASLSLPLQAKLLTALENRRIRRVGGTKDLTVDVRIIAASNLDLKQLVREGRFREDLYHRLDLFRIQLLPLREWGDSILDLAQSLMGKIAQRHHLSPRLVSETGRRRLLGYAWPGNVRELSHELERALIFEDGDFLSFDQLLGSAGPSSSNSDEAKGQALTDWFNDQYRFPESGFSLEMAVLRLIQHAMAQTQGNVSAAARLLGVSRDYLRYRLGGWKEGGKGDGMGTRISD